MSSSTTVAAAVLLLAVASAAVTAAQPVSANPAPKYIKIDGAVVPSNFPKGYRYASYVENIFGVEHNLLALVREPIQLSYHI